MKKIVWLTFAFLTFTLFGFNTEADANTVHTVKSGDTLWKLGTHYGVPVESIKLRNNRKSDTIFVGERLTIPASLSATDRDLLARLVRAEAEGEIYAGKVAVATVVLNRVDNRNFPNTVRGVIYEVSHGHHAFTPVQNGRINRASDAESRRAVNEALAFRGQGAGSLYFYNPRTSTNQWILSRQVTVRIGNHVFAK
ncbi:cell wall hydrolase [Alkalihalobacillus sp. LMS39]|uniref:cell wall hydrolase n=1 Tax=Alkalihalobacillus sp. LMS39 TaxID=2924032 RepID=UPI001FB327C9|nr:cell wall hydrolase [Alkalihalobacillus sp. LMS39]UOE93173.1 cell wall hydrolase [Alkalihalobacillus sp. LMS39]